MGHAAPYTGERLEVGDFVLLNGQGQVIAAQKLVDEGSRRMFLMTLRNTDPHPLDWWPEASVERLREDKP